VAAVLLSLPGSAQQSAAPPKPGADAPKIDPRLPKTAQASLLAQRGEALQYEGKVEEAAAMLQKAAETAADDPSLWDKAGWAHLDTGDGAAALKAFETAQKVGGAGARASGGVLIAQFALGKKDEILKYIRSTSSPEAADLAAPVVTRGLEAKPRTAEWGYTLAYLYVRVLGNSPRALRPLEVVTQLAPERADAWLLLAEANRSINDHENEQAAASKYLALAPGTPEAYSLRAGLMVYDQKFSEAVTELQAGIRKHPDAADLYYQLARLQERGGEPKLAEATYQSLVTAAQARKKDSLAWSARGQLAQFQIRASNFTAAETYYREAAARPGATAQSVSTWGSLLALLRRWPDAAKALENAAERQAGSTGTSARPAGTEAMAERYHAAVCRLIAGPRDAAKTGLNAAIALRTEARTSPEMEARAFLSWVSGPGTALGALAYDRSDERWAGINWKERPEPGEAAVQARSSAAAQGWRAILQEALAKNADCWSARYALARLSAAAARPEEAAAHLEKVAQLRPDWWAAHYALGDYYLRKRDKERAIAALTRTLQLAPACRPARAALSLVKSYKPDSEEF
jgi:tetratricopeptide (TPR) repeat protein